MIYQMLLPQGLFPPVIDEMEIHTLSMLLGHGAKLVSSKRARALGGDRGAYRVGVLAESVIGQEVESGYYVPEQKADPARQGAVVLKPRT